MFSLIASSIINNIKDITQYPYNYYRYQSSLSELSEGLRVRLLEIRDNSIGPVFNLWGGNMGINEVNGLAWALSANTSLKTLSLRDNTDEVGTKMFAKILKVNKSLTTFCFCGTLITDEVAREIAEGLKVNSMLECLDLDNTNITTSGIQTILEALSHNKSVVTLVLDNHNMDYEGIKAIADFVATNTNIRTLSLVNTNITTEDVKVLAEALKVNTSLVTLNLDNNYIDDESAEILSEALKSHSHLTTLSLIDNEMNDEGAEVLFKMVDINNIIKKIYLDKNNISSAYKNICDKIMIFKNLVIDNVKSLLENITNEEIEVLKARADGKFTDTIKKQSVVVEAIRIKKFISSCSSEEQTILNKIFSSFVDIKKQNVLSLELLSALAVHEYDLEIPYLPPMLKKFFPQAELNYHSVVSEESLVLVGDDEAMPWV